VGGVSEVERSPIHQRDPSVQRRLRHRSACPVIGMGFGQPHTSELDARIKAVWKTRIYEIGYIDRSG
jgi:hypothetical protein